MITGNGSAKKPVLAPELHQAWDYCVPLRGVEDSKVALDGKASPRRHWQAITSTQDAFVLSSGWVPTSD